MNRVTINRGPDHQQIKQLDFGNCQLFIGHTRLKILDLSDLANQPMTDSSGRYELIYNGMIYNYQDLKNELLRIGVHFHTGSDTEVLLYWLIRFGKKGIEKLDGMFSFILIDRENQTMLGGRDQSGMKPFYYHYSKQFLIISSSVKAILQTGLVSEELEPQSLEHLLNFRYVKQSQTIFKQIKSLPSGHIINYQNGDLQIDAFEKSLNENLHIDFNPQHHLEKLEESLIDEVGMHLLADKPVGLFLSGGIDSTLILAICQRVYGRNMPTFSISHSPEEGSFGTKDRHFSALAARQYGAIHTNIDVNSSILDKFDEFISIVDHPVGDSAAILTWQLSKNAINHVNVALSGAGADEWFAGYNRHKAFFSYLNNYNKWRKMQPILNGIANRLPDGIRYPGRKSVRLFKKFMKSIHPDPWQTYLNFNSFGLKKPDDAYFEAPVITNANRDSYLKMALDFDRSEYLCQDILSLSDDMSMVNGLEMRMPYLSRSVKESVEKIPMEYLFKNGKKWWLKEILRKYDGEAFLNRPKEGFGLPLGSWIRDRKCLHLFDFLNDKNCSIFDHIDQTQLVQQYNNHLAGLADNTLLLWNVAVIHHWLKKQNLR